MKKIMCAVMMALCVQVRADTDDQDKRVVNMENGVVFVPYSPLAQADISAYRFVKVDDDQRPVTDQEMRKLCCKMTLGIAGATLSFTAVATGVAMLMLHFS